MSDTPIQELVTNLVGEYVGKYLGKKEATMLVGRIVKGVLMTREGAGLSEKPGRSTQCSANEKSGSVTKKTEEGAVVSERADVKKKIPMPPGYEDPKNKKPRTLAIISMPYDNPNQDVADQDGSAPFAIQERE